MTYTHFGEIGDVWKHLPLAELLADEPPCAYWESHSASGLYELDQTSNQQYGAIRFFERADASGTLRETRYYEILQSYGNDEGKLTHYPGSPVVAMQALEAVWGDNVACPEYLFCDIDGTAVHSIEQQARRLGIAKSNCDVVHGDGISTLIAALDHASPAELAQTLIHIDPYRPAEEGEHGMSSWDLFERAIESGAKAMLWYGYQTKPEESEKDSFFEETIGSSALDTDACNLWVGEIAVNAFVEGNSSVTHPGVFGCGVVCGNVSEKTIHQCRAVGNALETIYSDAILPDGNDGSLQFTQPRY